MNIGRGGIYFLKELYNIKHILNICFQLKRETFAGGGDKEVVAEAERLEIKDKAPLILVEALFDVKVLTQLKQHRNLLLRVSFHFNLFYWKQKLTLVVGNSFVWHFVI